MRMNSEKLFEVEKNTKDNSFRLSFFCTRRHQTAKQPDSQTPSEPIDFQHENLKFLEGTLKVRKLVFNEKTETRYCVIFLRNTFPKISLRHSVTLEGVTLQAKKTAGMQKQRPSSEKRKKT